MQSLKKHYDKIILSAVLLVLLTVAIKLPFDVSAFRTELESVRQTNETITPALFEHADMSTNKTLIASFKDPKTPVLSGEHNLFNPRTWTRRPDLSLVKAQFGSDGLDGLRVTKIDELKLSVTYLGIDASTTSSKTYNFRFVNPEPRLATNTSKLQVQNRSGSSASALTLTRIAGPPDAPTSFTLNLKLPNRQDFEQITVTPSTPYERPVGYSADLAYPGAATMIAKRKGDTLPRFPGNSETYRIAGIFANDVTVQEVGTGRRKTIAISSGSGSSRTPAP